MSKHLDKLKGGLADKKKPSDFNKKKLKEGTKKEKEHTKDKSIAQEIAMDHLTEDKDYYKKLKQVEKKDMIEITADGKQEIVSGKEPLKKDPKASLRGKWKNLKKGLNNLESIMDLSEASKSDDQEDEDQEQKPDQQQTQEPYQQEDQTQPPSPEEQDQGEEQD